MPKATPAPSADSRFPVDKGDLAETLRKLVDFELAKASSSSRRSSATAFGTG
jgi:hypothetical protein